jgi:hypothetical protein
MKTVAEFLNEKSIYGKHTWKESTPISVQAFMFELENENKNLKNKIAVLQNGFAESIESRTN